MPTEKKVYSKEEIEEIINKTVLIIKSSCEWTNSLYEFKDNDQKELAKEITSTIIKSFEKQLKNKFNITPKEKIKCKVVKIKTKEDFEKAVKEILDEIFED